MGRHGSQALKNAGHAWAAALIVVATGGCARGCTEAEPSAHVAAFKSARGSQAAQVGGVETSHSGEARANEALSARPPPNTLPDRVGAQLGIELPGRVTDTVLPGFSTFPRRRLQRFAPEKALVVRINDAGATALGETWPRDVTDDDTKLQTAFRSLVQSWQQRSGTAANRVVLAFDRRTPGRLAARVRQAAHAAHSWRVVALAREDEVLFELMLDPPRTQRPQ